MSLTPLAPNRTELKLTGGLTVLFSYKTPVACRWTNGISATFARTEKKWSATTQRHITQWIGKGEYTLRPQAYFDGLVD